MRFLVFFWDFLCGHILLRVPTGSNTGFVVDALLETCLVGFLINLISKRASGCQNYDLFLSETTKLRKFCLHACYFSKFASSKFEKF